jgi:antitoxin component YwqK of YwqJK toxin-antitoxin module
MRRFYIVLFCGILITACKSKPINQTVDKKKEGIWIENYQQDSIVYKSVEQYKNDQPVKKWKMYIDRKIYKTEKYKNGVCAVKNYYKNGKLQSKGRTRIKIDSVETHWFYFGDWKFYSDKGKLTDIRKYNNGELISELEIK